MVSPDPPPAAPIPPSASRISSSAAGSLPTGTRCTSAGATDRGQRMTVSLVDVAGTTLFTQDLDAA